MTLKNIIVGYILVFASMFTLFLLTQYLAWDSDLIALILGVSKTTGTVVYAGILTTVIIVLDVFVHQKLFKQYNSFLDPRNR